MWFRSCDEWDGCGERELSETTCMCERVSWGACLPVYHFFQRIRANPNHPDTVPPYRRGHLGCYAIGRLTKERLKHCAALHSTGLERRQALLPWGERQ